MTGPRNKDWILWGLALLVVAQVALFGIQRGDAAEEARWLGRGDSVSDIHALSAVDRPYALDGGAPTLLLVFHSECGHCERVAPVWRDWLQEVPDGVRIVAASRESLESARVYAEHHGWNAEVVSVPVPRLGSRAHVLTARTPWIFVLDGEGAILAEGHGEGIETLGARFLKEAGVAAAQ